MISTMGAVLRSWPFEPWVTFPLLLIAVVYLHGWFILFYRDSERWRPRQPMAFLGGLVAIFMALASPIEPFAGLLLQVHMVQHLLLMMVAPPLLWLGTPLLPMLRGLPGPIRTYWIAPLFRWKSLRWLFDQLTRPVPAWILFVASTWVWHIPAIYGMTLRSEGWHYIEHVCFLLTAMLFWYPVVRPFPCRLAWSRWLLIPYLLLADVQNTALAAIFTFADEPLYRHYDRVPRVGGISVLDDQAVAGALMWVPGSVAFLLPLFAIGVKLLFGGSGNNVRRPKPTFRRMELDLVMPNKLRKRPWSFDVLRVPLLGPFLQWRHARMAMQIPMLFLAALVIWDGLRGPAATPLNLAGVLPWIHWRGLVVLGLLVAGNVFCMGCPFLLPRTLARWFLPEGRSWPRVLRNKWPAIVLLALFLWSYEAFALWDSPWWTAWIAIGYFAAAFVIDGLFRGAAFCKYVCPIGQFNFVQSLVSPLEVRVREPEVCEACTTKDCIRGRDNIPGCELNLFLPRKAGNMDCTICLDCVHACPHDNVAIGVNLPGSELWKDPQRSGIGRFSRRWDLAILVLLLVFGAFANAAGMIAPIVAFQERISSWLGQDSPLLATTLFYVAALLVLPALIAVIASVCGRLWSGTALGGGEIVRHFAFALVPLGAAMWLTHYSFHFLTSYDAVIPAGQRFAREMGMLSGDATNWICDCCRPVAGWLLRMEILFLDLGLLLSLYTAHRIAANLSKGSGSLSLFLPWAVVILLLFALGVWIVFQPMQMRGTMDTVG